MTIKHLYRPAYELGSFERVLRRSPRLASATRTKTLRWL